MTREEAKTMIDNTWPVVSTPAGDVPLCCDEIVVSADEPGTLVCDCPWHMRISFVGGKIAFIQSRGWRH